MHELAYSIHLGSDKNRSKVAKKVAKNNNSSTTSFSNNAIQNSQQLSKVNKHNLRDYDHKTDEIEIVYGSNNLYQDVQNLYLQEFQKSQIEYDNKQIRADRKIGDYFTHISNDSKHDLACELIIELGDMDFWNEKTMEYKKQMTEVYKEQIYKLMEIVPAFKVANAVVHYDETSPHMHLVGVSVKEGYKNGMKKQVAKSQIFTKTLLKEIQDKMRVHCIEKFNEIYEQNATLKTKRKGRNQDINVNDMGGYRELKREQEKITLNKYGRMRLNYLKENKKAEYSIMLMDGTLNKHLKEIQETANTRVKQIIKQLKVKSNLTEDMKNTDILYWMEMMQMKNLRGVKDDLLKEWIEFREETKFCEMTPQDKKYCIYFDEIAEKILKNVPEQNKKYVQKQLEQLDKNFMDYLYYWNEKYYRNGFADVIELLYL